MLNLCKGFNLFPQDVYRDRTARRYSSPHFSLLTYPCTLITKRKMPPDQANPQKYIDRSFALRYAGSDQFEEVNAMRVVQNRYVTQLINTSDEELTNISQRQNLVHNECGRDFTIVGPDNMEWKIGVQLITAHCQVIKKAYVSPPFIFAPSNMLTTPPQIESDPKISSFSLESYKPLFIDCMMRMAYIGVYTINPPHHYRLVTDRHTYNLTPNPDDDTAPILLHFGVYGLAKDLAYNELAFLALHNMRECMMEAPLELATFITLKNNVWHFNIDLHGNDPMNVRAEGEDLAVRKLLATYAAQWHPVWKQKYRNIWEAHTALPGTMGGFPFWLKKAKGDVKRLTRRRPEVVEACLKGEVSDSEISDDEVVVLD